MEILRALRKKTGSPCLISFEAGREYEPQLKKLFIKGSARGDFYTLKIELAHDPRSTGPQSQNHRLNGFVQQVCTETGNSYRTVKDAVYDMAMDRGYPFETFRGKRYAKSEADSDVKECMLLIECIQQIAAELDIRLREV